MQTNVELHEMFCTSLKLKVHTNRPWSALFWEVCTKMVLLFSGTCQFNIIILPSSIQIDTIDLYRLGRLWLW